MVRCSSSSRSLVRRKAKKTEIRINENTFNEIVLILNRATKGVILLVECNSIPIRNKLIENLRERTKFEFYNITLDEKNKNLPARINFDFESKKIGNNTVVLVHRIEDALPEIIGYLNWNREIFLELNLKTIIFCPTFIIDMIMSDAPDFYRFAHKITIEEEKDISGKVKHLSLTSFIYYESKNELMDRIKIQERLLASVKEDYKIADILYNLGGMYYLIGDYYKSINYLKNSIEIYKKIGNKANECKCYPILGIAHNTLGDFRKAIEYHEKALKICLEISDKSIEGKCYANLGLAYYNLGYLGNAIEYNEKALKISLEIGDKSVERACYANLGLAYYSMGDFRKAIEYHEKALKICLEIGDKTGEGICYGNLGNVYYSLGNFRKTIEYYLKAGEIFKEIRQEHYLKIIYENIAIAYREMDNYKEAEEYKRKGKEIST